MRCVRLHLAHTGCLININLPLPLPVSILMAWCGKQFVFILWNLTLSVLLVYSFLEVWWLFFFVVFFFFLIQVTFREHKVNHLKFYNSLAFSTLTVLCNHHPSLVPKHFHPPSRNPIPISTHRPPFPLKPQIYFLSPWICLFWTFFINRIVQYPWSFMSGSKVLIIQDIVYQHLIPFYGRVILHHPDRL